MGATALLRPIAALLLTLLPVQAAVFSDDPNILHDPRHPQSRAGADKMFAPIGVFRTDHPVVHQNGDATTSYFDMATAFLVSPCLVMANFHVVYGNRHVEPQPGQDFSGTFLVRGGKFHAVPMRYGAYYANEWQDWVLLKLDSDGGHPCIGEDPKTGWVQLTSLSRDEAPNKALSVAGYPSDKPLSSLWRQDTCHLYEMLPERQYRGLWTTDCPTRPSASGSPIFFIQDGVLKVVALMQGHMGPVHGDEILPRWNPARANLAVDMGALLSSDSEVMKLIQDDIDRFRRAQAEQPAAVREPGKEEPAPGQGGP